MPEIDEKTVMRALSGVQDPAGGRDIVALQRVSGIAIEPSTGGLHVRFMLEVDPAQGGKLELLRQQAEQAVRDMPGVAQVSAVLTAHRQPKAEKGTGAARRPEIQPPGVRFIVAVASGKGGVGKSTTAVNLALALARRGLRVGLLDADIHGPSVPQMFGINTPPVLRDDKKLEPVRRHGVAVMSIGFLLKEDSAVVWRGPMVQGAIQQMLRDVAWGDLDILLIDLPPGTGDAQLAVTQQLALAGAVIVSTPQDIALMDARRGLQMFRKVNVPVLGLIENMSYFVCPHCQGRSEIFSHGGARAEAERLGCAFLGEIPLELAIRQSMDEGAPVTVSQPESAPAAAYGAIADQIWAALQSPHDAASNVRE